MDREGKISAHRITVSLLFGLLGFIANFYTITFSFGEYRVVILFGLLFPLLITLSWGWKYGLLSALFGGCQSMWWIWGPSHGYALFFVVIPFTLWIVWHGIWTERVGDNSCGRGLPGLFLVELPFRLLNSLNLLTLTRMAAGWNPPSWQGASGGASPIPLSASLFVVVKEAAVALVLLLLADTLLNFNGVRAFFRLKPLADQRRTAYLTGLSLLMGCAYWFIDSLFFALARPEGGAFADYFARNIPVVNLFNRLVFLLFSLTFAMIIARILRRQREAGENLERAREEALRGKAFLSALFDTIPDYIWLKDTRGVYLSCNAKFAGHLGKGVDEIIGTTDYSHFPETLARDFENYDREVMEKGETVVFVTDNRRISPHHRELIETIKAPMYDRRAGEEKIIGVLGIGRDISERTNLRDQLNQAQKMESIGRLAGGVAHDFNNMLSVILGESDLLMDELPEGDRRREYVKEILNAAERSENLTRQLLTFARKQTISPRIVHLNQSVSSLLKLLRRLIGENIELTWTPGEDLWPIKADPVQVDQILANLCVNAGDSIEDIGRVEIETGNVTLEEDFCGENGGFHPGDYVLLRVRDTGQGMSREIREHIFEPFYTTKERGKGTGLGLATVFGIMEQHRGGIHVSSVPGEGSVFTVYFPRTGEGEGESGEDRPPRESEEREGERETILLVEDEEALIGVITRQLEALGYGVLPFTSAGEAIQRCGKGDRIDLLITDVIMPEMNGRDALRRIREILPHIPCLFISGYTDDVISQKGLLEEGYSFLSKPFTRDVLGDKVREVLGRVRR